MSVRNQTSVWILIPAFNEAQHIGQCIVETREAFPAANILVVDNNSTDATAELARAAGAQVIVETRQGKGFAVTAGVRLALESGGAWLALHDADREYKAGHLAELVGQCQAAAGGGVPLVMGIGLREVMLGQVLWRSLIANFVARLALRFALRKCPPDDILTGARVMSAPLANALFLAQGDDPYRGFELETALTRRAMRLDATLVSHRIRYVPRIATEKKIKARDMFGILKAAFNG
ncbi:glycosyltransferase family 2 protein [Achromobacter xylosoxidans]